MRIATVLNRSLSLLVVAGYLIVAHRAGQTGEQPPTPVVCALPILALIWFGDAIGSFTGSVGRGGNIDRESPGCLVCALGWFLLIGLPVVLHVARS